ncbi:hypothetical protein D9757_005112 [Collybiopsis confluens]|uniref:Uncharacterized protein n=1 Tax=Collybiopsis confluens TaxID=2823264 RepID=A0A8H5HSX5_9AGAR|nr:hypothetical protein D9757_005112 [Collybiopsis confluens]
MPFQPFTSDAPEFETRSPPTLDEAAQTNQLALRVVSALNPGDSPADITSPIVVEEAEELLKKARLLLSLSYSNTTLPERSLQNAAHYSILLGDHKSAIESLKEAIAKQKQVTASLEETLAILEAVHGV